MDLAIPFAVEELIAVPTLVHFAGWCVESWAQAENSSGRWYEMELLCVWYANVAMVGLGPLEMTRGGKRLEELMRLEDESDA
jgi:hypothetical protein